MSVELLGDDANGVESLRREVDRPSMLCIDGRQRRDPASAERFQRQARYPETLHLGFIVRNQRCCALREVPNC